jgi:hypothetical protein
LIGKDERVVGHWLVETRLLEAVPLVCIELRGLGSELAEHGMNRFAVRFVVVDRDGEREREREQGMLLGLCVVSLVA